MTSQVPVPPEPDSVQEAGLKLPVPLLLKLTAPVGVPLPLTRETVAVQVVALETMTGLGAQASADVLGGASPAAKSPKAVKPVAWMLIAVRPPIAGEVQPAEYLCTMKMAGSPPPITSAGTKLKVALEVVKARPPPGTSLQ